MSTKAKILVVDDEETICEVLKLNLEIAGYEVDTALSAEEALRMELSHYDLILLDVMMKEISGFEMAARIRADQSLKHIPIIICTAKDSEEDLLHGFNQGADDYIKKPFSMKELIVRVKSVLRRAQNSDDGSDVITYKTLVLKRSVKVCTIDDATVELTKKEFEILWMLLQNPNHVFSREEILARVWDANVYVIDRTIDVNINRLRKKIGDYSNNIFTKLGYGYGFKI